MHMQLCMTGIGEIHISYIIFERVIYNLYLHSLGMYIYVYIYTYIDQMTEPSFTHTKPILDLLKMGKYPKLVVSW